jgi:hypothetical protein
MNACRQLMRDLDRFVVSNRAQFEFGHGSHPL